MGLMGKLRVFVVHEPVVAASSPALVVAGVTGKK